MVSLLKEYNFEINYTNHIVADAMTRMDGNELKWENKIKIGINIIKDETVIFSKQEIINGQQKLREIEKRGAKIFLIIAEVTKIIIK